MFSQQSFLKVIWPLFLWTFSASAQNIDFYVTTPGSSEKETDADVVSNDAFKMICKYKATNKQSRLCEALWIYGSAEKRLAEFYSRDGTGRIGESYEAMAKTSMNVTYEISSEGTELRIELDVFRATKSLFDFPSYYCRCVNVNTAQGHVSLKIHEPTAPIKMKVYQEPSPPYLEGQIVKLSCSSEAWPSTTKYELEANQIPIYEKTENESLTGIEHQIKIDNAVHGNIECVATNKIGSSRKQFEVTIHAKPALSMSRSPPNDIRADTRVTIECHSLVQSAAIKSLSLLQNESVVTEVRKEPFDVTFEVNYSRAMASSLFKCLLVPFHYPLMQQSRTVDFIYGPIVSVTSDTVRVKQVEERDSFYLVCLVQGSSKLITSFAQSCSWTGHGISANLVEYFEIESEKLQLKVRLYASMLRVGFHEFRCQCNIDLVQYLTNNVVRVQIFNTQSIKITTSLLNGCYTEEDFTIGCETEGAPAVSEVSLTKNETELRSSLGQPLDVEIFTPERISALDGQTVNFQCELSYISVATPRKLIDQIVLPNCEISMEGLQPSYNFNMEAPPSSCFLSVLIKATGVLSFYQVTWTVDEVMFTRPVSKLSESQLASNFTLEHIDLSLHATKVIVQIQADGFPVQKRESLLLFFLKANFFDCFDVQAAIGSEAKLVWKFDAFPLPTTTEIEVEKDGISLDHTQPHLAHSLQPVSESEASFELLVPVNSERDYGTYVLTVTNNAGSTQKSLLLNYTVNPLLPMLIDFKPISPKETLVVWHMREENLGGSTDFFQLKTWDTDSGDPEPLEEKIQSSSSEEVRDYSWKLTGLQRDRVYIVQLRSCNNQELCSPWSEEKVLNMSDPVMLGLLGGEQQVESARASAVLISFFVVIAVCALLLTAAALFISRRKCNEKKMKEERLASRSADGYASMPSRTVMRIPPPSPANTRSYSTLDWCKLSDGSNGGSSVGEYPPFMLTTPRKGGPVNDPNGLMYTFSPSGSYPFDHIDTTDADERVMQQQTPISPPLAGEDGEGEGEGDDEGDELEGAHHQDEYDDSPYSHLHHRVQSQHQPDHSSRSPYANTSPRGMFAANNSTTLSRTGKI
ncbi:uncharacterized protein LOC134844376 isoform X3 [Symsagittifera roscoffensis]|uniref:uncharacterized protein LOC134844376 isoform X3 n=1 Tax=Symsagittifera roscoffensis TaxID=84072 RepID=UPI00307B8BDE